MLSGAVLLGLGLVLASRATSLIEFQLVYGLLVGLAAFWKVIAVGGVAAVAAIGSFVKRLTRRDTPPMG